MSAMTLMPCPFCGNADRVHIREQLGDIWFHVECAHCDSKTTTTRDLSAAVAAWNRRARLTQPAQSVTGPCDEKCHRIVANRAYWHGVAEEYRQVLHEAKQAIAAQSVDVEEIREVIAELNCTSHFCPQSSADFCGKLADKLTAALTEKANG